MQIIFDIDGTLTACHDVDFQVFFDSLEEGLGVEGVSRDLSDYPEVTDSSILQIVSRKHLGRDPTHAESAFLERQFASRIRDRTKARVRYSEMPGATSLVAELEERGVPLGIATGNWRSSAQVKLEAIGLERLIKNSGTATDAVRRADIIRKAATVDSNHTWYIGDGEWDMRSAAELGINFLGVGERVKRFGPEHWVADLSDRTAILGLLLQS